MRFVLPCYFWFILTRIIHKSRRTNTTERKYGEIASARREAARNSSGTNGLGYSQRRERRHSIDRYFVWICLLSSLASAYSNFIFILFKILGHQYLIIWFDGPRRTVSVVSS